MASEKVYTGAMIAALETKIDTMTDRLDTMITDLAAHTTKLGEISAGVSQGVSELNVKVGTAKEVSVNAVDKVVSITGGVYTTAFTLAARCNGIVTVSGRVKSASGSAAIDMGVAKNGAAAASVWAYNGDINAYYDFSFNLTVSAGDAFVIQVKDTSISTATVTIEAAAKIKYTLLDIITEGAFAIS